jgi:hypothetical protein
MARSLWIKMVMAALASGGVALGQAADPPPVASTKPAERIVTVREKDKPPQRCRVVKTWKMDDGNTAMQVEALDTGEVMTIVEEGAEPAPPVAGSRVRTMTTRIFHWGPNKSAPPGVPVPPPTAVAQNAPVTGLATHAANVAPPAPQHPPSTYSPATASAGQQTWPRAFETRPETAGGRPDAVAQAPQPPVSRPVSPPAPTPTVSSPAPAVTPPPPPAMPPVIAEKKETHERGPLARLFHRDNTPRTVAGEKIVPVPPNFSSYSQVTTAASPTSAKTEVAQAQPKDWRESWGKIEAPKNDPAKGEGDSPHPLPARTVSQTTELPRPTASKLPDPPRVDPRKPDPLREPVNYTRKPAATVMESRPAVPTTLPRPTQPVLAQANSDRPMPLGAGSVLAAGDVQYVPVPVVTTPNLTRMPEPPPAKVPQAPQPNETLFTNAFTPPPGAVPVPARGTEMANAFSTGAAGMMPPVMMGTAPANPYALMAAGMNPVPAPMIYQMPMASPGRPLHPAGYPGQAPAPAPDVPQTLSLLRDSLYPSQREWAAGRLAAGKGINNPQVVQALLTAAKEDPAPPVRAACIRSLVKLNAATLPVIEALQAMQGDTDATVRREAELALANLTAGRRPAGVQPAGAIAPAKP